jgi:hypothetical protein
MKNVKAWALIALLLPGCSPLRSGIAPAPDEPVLIVVADTFSQTLEDVTVFLFSDRGARELGKTDSAGFFHLDRVLIEHSRAGVLILCKEGFFCGALPLTEPTFLEYEEHYIHLAPFAVR